LAALPEDIRRTLREEVRRDLGDTGGPVNLVVRVVHSAGQNHCGLCARSRRWTATRCREINDGHD